MMPKEPEGTEYMKDPAAVLEPLGAFYLGTHNGEVWFFPDASKVVMIRACDFSPESARIAIEKSRIGKVLKSDHHVKPRRKANL